MLEGKRVLITGAGGFLGSWLSKTLVGKGALVTGLDREYREHALVHEVKESADLVVGDVEDFKSTLETVKDKKIEFIYHLAAQSIVGIAAKEPVATFRSNIEGTWNILEIARALGQTADVSDRHLRGIILASSDKAYGDQEVLPYMEDAPMQGRFPYDVSKSCADLIARSYFASYKVPVCITRCGNLFGAGDLNMSRIVPDTLTHALRGKAVRVRSDGTPVRDYLYIKDAVSAYIMLSEKMWSDCTIYGEAFNISYESPMPVTEVVRKVLKVVDREDLEPVIEGTARGEIHAQYLDAAKIRATIGWKPQYDFESGLRESVDWYAKLARKLEEKEAATSGSVTC